MVADKEAAYATKSSLKEQMPNKQAASEVRGVHLLPPVAAHLTFCSSYFSGVPFFPSLACSVPPPCLPLLTSHSPHLLAPPKYYLRLTVQVTGVPVEQQPIYHVEDPDEKVRPSHTYCPSRLTPAR